MIKHELLVQSTSASATAMGKRKQWQSTSDCYSSDHVALIIVDPAADMLQLRVCQHMYWLTVSNHGSELSVIELSTVKRCEKLCA